jgi:phosphinothricin acetyltransferase
MAVVTGTIKIRDSCESDVSIITNIYFHWVTNDCASFELEPPDAEEMSQRRSKILASGFPYIVAENSSGTVIGYAYADSYRTRPAYRFSCENSVYVAQDACGHGVGRALLAALIKRCEAIGLRLMVAVISGSASSLGLHTALGFERAGILPSVGWKHGRWLDCTLMVRPLGEGCKTAPAQP